MEFWFTFQNNAERLQLPVNPEELKIKQGSQNSTLSVSRLGEISVIQDPKLRTFSFSGFFPARWGPYCAYRSIPDPGQAYETLDRWKNSGWPVRFIITGSDVNVPVTIESLSVTEKGGDPDTLYYDLSLQEYRFVKPRKVEAGENAAPTSGDSARPGTSSIPSSYTVKAGDSLWKIAQQYLQDGSRYKEVASLNGISSPYVIHPGDELRLPSGGDGL